MMDKRFETEWEKLLEEQKRGAGSRRLEMLNRDLSGSKRMLEVLWPALKSFEGIILEHEIVSTIGVKVYIDVCLEPLGFALESDGFATHAEQITRDRFSFERMKIRSIAKYGFKYIPFSRDELDKKPEQCLQSIYELLGRYGILSESATFSLSVFEREILRLGLAGNRSFSVEQAMRCLQLGANACRHVLRSLVAQGLLEQLGGSERRFFKFQLSERGRAMILGSPSHRKL